MSYPNPYGGYGQAPYPPQGGAPYPPQGGAPYPPQGGAPYPPQGGAPYPPQGGAPYPPQGGAPYPPAGGAPYPPQNTSPYPPAPGGSPYPPQQGGAPYPPQNTSPYPPAQGGAPYPGSSPYPPAPGGSPYPPAQGGSPYPPQGSSPYPAAPGASPYPPAPGGSPYPGSQGNPYGQQITPTNIPQNQTGYPDASGQPTSQSYTGGYPQNVQNQGVGTVGGSLLHYNEIPTVKPQTPFDPSSDASALRKAMKGFGTDEAAIIAILSNRTSHERQQIMLKYQQSYGRDLIKDLKSELSGKFEDVVLALMTPLPTFLARELHAAMEGMGTHERTLVEILCTRDNASLMMIKNAYYHEYQKKIEEALHGETSGDFRRLLISMCACCRDERNSDPALANNLAQQLYKAGEGKLGTNEGEFNRIMSNYSYPLLRCVFEEYKKIKGKSFVDAIKSELSGDLQLGMEALYYSIDNRAAYFAQELHHSMKGMGTNDRALIRLVVSRSEIDMGNIKQEYQTLYEKPLEKAIESETSGDYKRVLLALVQS